VVVAVLSFDPEKHLGGGQGQEFGIAELGASSPASPGRGHARAVPE